MNLTKEQQEIFDKLKWEDFEVIYEERYARDFIEIHGSNGGDSLVLRYYPRGNDGFAVFEK